MGSGSKAGRNRRVRGKDTVRKPLPNLWHRKLATRRANREPSSGFLALVIYDNYTPLPTVWRVCPPLPISWPPNAWHRPPVRPALMIRGIEPASEKNPPRTAISSFFPTLPRVSPLPFPSYSFLPPRSINRPVFHSSPRCFDFEAYSRFRGRLEFRCFSKMEYLDGHFRRSSVAS